MRLVQLELGSGTRGVAMVDGPSLRLLEGTESTLELAREAYARGVRLAECVEQHLSARRLSYRDVVGSRSLLPPVDHPDPDHLLISGTGLTHLESADTRNAMHGSTEEATETDSRALYRLGVERGKPADGSVGVQPEWFFKGTGRSLTRPGHALCVPDFSLDAGEEPEVVGLYFVAEDGVPCRIGFALGNELSDHVTESKNYLYLAHSKLRPCSMGPELLLGELPDRLEGESRIRRAGEIIWRKSFRSGEANMSHRVSGLEYHHFKYAAFRTPGLVHAHFLGTSTLSFADGVQARPGDSFEIECEAFGQPLENRLERAPTQAPTIRIL